MKRKNKAEIKDYYQKSNVAAGYDDRRFIGFGGKYINETEINVVLKAMKKNLRVDSPEVLDLGAGRGRLSIPLLKSGFQVSCLDASKNMLAFLKKDFADKNIYIQSVFDKLKAPRKFDAVTSLRFFDHFDLKDQKKILLNTGLWLRKDGLYFFASLSSSSLESLISMAYPYGRYNYYISNVSYKRLFNDSGFKCIDIESAFFIPRGVFLHTNHFPGLQKFLIGLDKTVLRLFPSLGAMKVYILRKI